MAPHLLHLVVSAGGEVAVTAALLHVMSPQQVELLFAVSPHALVSLRGHRQAHQIYIFIDGEQIFGGVFPRLCRCLVEPSPCTFLGGAVHCEANKGRGVSPGVIQALREEQ